jgi:uncharacterized protein (DUF885 family)
MKASKVLARHAVLYSICCFQLCWPQSDSLSRLSEDFWQWRAHEQPFSTDDIPRLERPAGLTIDWSQQTILERQRQLAAFEERWKRVAPGSGAAISQQVDYRLVDAALARVRWELDIEQGWKRNPLFYVDQTLGAMYLLLLPPPPFEAARQAEIVHRLATVPATIRAAKANLTDMREPFARLAIDALDNLPDRMKAMRQALAPLLTKESNEALEKVADAAVAALDDYRQWLRQGLPKMRHDTAIGRENYLFFLRNIAILPYSPEQLLQMSQQEWSRSVAFESFERARNANAPAQPIFPTAQAQIDREKLDEEQIRQFLEQHQLLTVPAGVKHYRNLLVPAYVLPFEDLGVSDDLTGPSRLNEDGVSYIREPRPNLGFFYLSTAKDPRPIVVHEGVPGHYFQLCLSWANPDPIRRHYHDSIANEGIGFYAEEMMLQAGLFDNNPRTRETIYSFMRLRALRVEADVKLATGVFSLQQAADYLAKTVPMDAKTALEEAALFSSAPGQAISYQIGKIEIMNLLADARRSQGDGFSLLKFHDFVWSNGNVPLSLQRWELLGDTSEVPVVMDGGRRQ